jgi:S1-C subfamily serine protease
MKRRGAFHLTLALLCLAALPGGLGAQQPPQDLQSQIAGERRSVIVEAVQKVSPSVASVVVSGVQRVPLFNDPFIRDFFLGPTAYRRFTAQSGSAVMISAAGEFLTNQHVVAGADAIALLLPNGETRAAEAVGMSAALDLALLRIDPEGLHPATMGKSRDLMVGEWLVAVGYPVGGREVTGDSRFQATVTVGVVSAMFRSFTPSRRTRGREQLFYADMIQTDAAINPGNSGGPLANASGEIVGINTFILTDSGGSQGLGFAIPIERALKAAEEIRRYGRVREVDLADLKVLETDMADGMARELGLQEPRGLVVTEPGVAAAAGLLQLDVILDVDGKRVDTLEEAQLALLPRFVGDRVILGVWREGARIEVPLILAESRR